MPITLTPAQRQLLASGQVAIRVLVDFYLDSGRYSFWDGAENFSYDGTVYAATGDWGEASAISLGQDLGAEGIELRLNGTKLAEDSPDPFDPGALFGTIEEETYQLRRCEVHYAFFDPTDMRAAALIMVVRRFAGLIDQIRQVEEIDERTGAATAYLVVSLESVARRYGVRGGRTRSHEDQSEVHPGDTFFKFTSPSVQGRGGIWWGRNNPSDRGQVAGGGASADAILRMVNRV